MNPTYLGDGLYADFDGYQTELYADAGGERHSVYLDDTVLGSFLRFIEQTYNVKIVIEKKPAEEGGI